MLINSAASFFICAFIFSLMSYPPIPPRQGKIYALIVPLFFTYIAVAAFQPFWTGKLSLGAAAHYTQGNAARMLILCYMFSGFVVALKSPKARRYTLHALIMFMAIDLIGLVIGQQFGRSRMIMDATTFDAAVGLIVWWLWLMRGAGSPKSISVLAWIVFALSAYMAGYTVVLCASVGAMFLLYWQIDANALGAKIKSGYLITCALLIGAGGAALASLDTAFARFHIWAMHLKDMISDPALLFLGHGPGSFEWQGLSVPSRGTRYLLMHSDYVQIFYEFGAPLALLFIAFVLVTIYKLRFKAGPFIGAAMYAALMLVYFPLHFGASVILGALILSEAIYDNAERTPFPLPDSRYEL